MKTGTSTSEFDEDRERGAHDPEGRDQREREPDVQRRAPEAEGGRDPRPADAVGGDRRNRRERVHDVAGREHAEDVGALRGEALAEPEAEQRLGEEERERARREDDERDELRGAEVELGEPAPVFLPVQAARGGQVGAADVRDEGGEPLGDPGRDGVEGHGGNGHERGDEELVQVVHGLGRDLVRELERPEARRGAGASGGRGAARATRPA